MPSPGTYKELVANDALVLALLMDMTLYERVPELLPLRRIVLQGHSALAHHREAGPVDDSELQAWFKALTSDFFRYVGMLVNSGKIEQLKALKLMLLERHKLSVGTLILPCPGVGRVVL